MDVYATKMRLALSDDHIRKPDGSINHQYFLVKKGQYWSEEMQTALIEHLGKDGIANWKAFQKGVLEQTSEIELELRVCILLKISDISHVPVGTKFSKEDIRRVAEENEVKAKASNKLKYGLLMV